MEKRGWFVLVIFIFLVITLFLSTDNGITGAVVGTIIGTESVEVDPAIFNELNNGEETSVIIVLKDDLKTTSSNLEIKKEAIKINQEEVLEELNLEETEKLFGILKEEKEFEINRKFTTTNALSGEINKEGLKKLMRDPNVEKIIANGIFQIALTESIPQMNVDEAWDIIVNNQTITGKGQTICILDTGIDTDHPAFENKILAEHCYCENCCDNSTSEGNSAEDDNGHGTHVTGIAAGNHSTYKGVAKDANIVSIKVCNSNGNCNTDDIIAGIEWCANNASTYNISVISISIGGGGPYNTYCDANSYNIAPAINHAVAQNLTVAVATGNNGFTTGISIPGCVENATPVGAVNTVNSMAYNRGSLLKLVAPGSSITSTYNNGGTATMSGTSMSTPHLAGAVALLSQYWQLAYNKTLTKEGVEAKFINTGILIDDTASSGNNYTLVNMLAALQPYINITSHQNIISETTFFINVTSDLDLSTAILEWDYGNGTIINYSMNQINLTNYEYEINNLNLQSYTYTVYGNDSVNTWGQKTQTIEVNIPPQILSINSPINQSNFTTIGSELIIINVSINDTNSNIDTVLFNISNGNSTTNLIANNDGNLDWTATLNLSTLSEEIHLMTIFVNNTAGNINDSESITFTIDDTAPTINLISPADGLLDTSSNEIIFSYNVTDLLTDVTGCNLYLNNELNLTDNNITESNSQTFTQTLSNGNYEWLVGCTDTLNNQANSSTYNLNLTLVASVSLDSPSNLYNSSSSTINFDCSATHNLNLANITLYSNWGSWHANETVIVSGISNSTTFTKTLSDGTYLWNCLVKDINGNPSFASANRSFTIDTTAPTLSSISSGTPTTSSTEISWTTNELSNSTLNYGTTTSLGTISSSSTLITVHSMTLTGLDADTKYHYIITSCDSLNNCQTSSSDSFTTATDIESDSSSSSSSSGGGGGSSGASTTATETLIETIIIEEPVIEQPPAEEQPEPATDDSTILHIAEDEILLEESATSTNDNKEITSRSNLIGGAVGLVSGGIKSGGSLILVLIWTLLISLGIIIFKQRHKI